MSSTPRPRTASVLVLIALLAALLPAAPAAAWGPIGHHAVGRIADNHLTPKAARAVERLLGPESLAQVGVWADYVRSDPDWRHADDWHWVTIPDGMTYGESEKNPNGDVLEALARFEATLRDDAAPLGKQRDALRFLVHMMGDLHQPLHVGTGADRGGNQVLVTWMGEPTNLHTVWDDKVIESEELSFSELAEFLGHPTPSQVAGWSQGTYVDWAMESMALRPLVYDLGDRRLSWDYRYRAIPVIHERILQAGVRLAWVLNEIYD
jgi:hypothetical protein